MITTNDLINEINKINKTIKENKKSIKLILKSMNNDITNINEKNIKEIESKIYFIKIQENNWHKKLNSLIEDMDLVFWRRNGIPRVSKLSDVQDNVSFLML